MKITFILPGYPRRPSGGAKVVYELANQLVQHGHLVAVVHPRFIRKRYSGISGWLFARAAQCMKYFYRRKIRWVPLNEKIKLLYVPEPTVKHIPDADVVFATAWQTAYYVADYPAQKGKKFYLIQDFYPFFGEKETLEKTWRLPLNKITISGWIRDQIIACGIPSHEIKLIIIGIDGSRFRLMNEISNRERIIVMMYSKSNYKAPEDGIEAMRIVREKYPDVSFVLFGPVSRPVSLPNWIGYYSCINEDDLVKIYNSCSIFISSSLAEGFAAPPAEAMACGCAVAITDSGGIREYAENETNALISRPRNPKQLAENILRLLEDDELRVKLAVAGNKKVKEFTWERSADLLEGYLNENAISKNNKCN